MVFEGYDDVYLKMLIFNNFPAKKANKKRLCVFKDYEIS